MEKNSYKIIECEFNLLRLKLELSLSGFNLATLIEKCPLCIHTEFNSDPIKGNHQLLHQLLNEFVNSGNTLNNNIQNDIDSAIDTILGLLTDNRGQPDEALQVISTDIKSIRHAVRSEVKRIDAEEERFKLLLSATQDAVWDWDMTSNSLWWNEGYYKLFGYNSKDFDVSSETWTQCVHPDDKDRVLSTIQNAIDNKLSRFDNEYRFKKSDGSYAFVLDRGYTVFSKEGEPVRMVGSMTDITAQKEYEKQIRANEGRLQAVFDSVFDGIAVFDLSGHIVMSNKAQAIINGFRNSEDMNRNLEYFAKVYELKYPDDSTCPVEEWPISRVYRGESFSNYILRGKRTDTGREWVFSFSGAPVMEGEKMVMAVVVTRDITDMASATEELSRQNRLMQLITSNATTGLLIMDNKQKCTFMNEAAEKIVGYSLEEILTFNKPLHDIIHHTHPDGSHYPMKDCPIDRALPTKNNTSGTDVFVRPDGAFYDVTFNASPIVEKGVPIGTVIEIRDITEDKRRQAELNEREEQFRIIANNIQSLAWMAHPDGDIFWYNKQWYDYTGTTYDDMKGWGWQKVHHPDYRNKVLDFVKTAWVKAEPFELIFPLRSASGEYRRFLTRAYPVKDESGKLLRWVGTNTDVEEQQSFTEKLEHQVKERTKQLREMNQNLSQFAHVTSHDLKEPVRKIRMFITMLRDSLAGNLSDETSMYIDRLNSSADRINRMIEGILKYSSVEASSADFKKVNLNNLLNAVITDLELLIREKGASINLPTNLPEIEGIEVMLNQLFYNLINNALKFCEEQPRITIEASVNKTGNTPVLKISVADNGIGFDQKYTNHIFQAFTRLHSKDSYEGTGLGLALCKKVVDKHNGTINAISEKGKGTTFLIELPLSHQ